MTRVNLRLENQLNVRLQTQVPMVLENMQEKCLASHYLSTSSTMQRRKEMEKECSGYGSSYCYFSKPLGIAIMRLKHHAILPPRLAQQLMWSRFVNTHNKPGCNIPCDLHLEHMNRTVKTAVQNLGANATPKAITRIGRCVGPIMKVCSHFDSNTNVAQHSGAHSERSFTSDLTRIVQELDSGSKVFRKVPARKRHSFRTLSGSIINNIEYSKLKEWMDKHWAKLTSP